MIKRSLIVFALFLIATAPTLTKSQGTGGIQTPQGDLAPVGTWRTLTNQPSGGAGTCLLMTDGTVMCHVNSSNRWNRLTPDANGSYLNGTWSALATMPNGTDTSGSCAPCTYAPLYFASAVLPDGRVVVIGGEYNSNVAVETNIGFMYNPVTNAWSTQLTEPFGTGRIGDAQSVVTQDGRMLLAAINNGNIAAFNPATLTFSALNPTGKKVGDHNNEENWHILPDGRVLTVDAWVPNSYEIYDPTSNAWSNGSTPVNLADTGTGTGNSKEVGPAIMRPDGTLVYFSGNPVGQNAVYNTVSGTWSHTAQMDFPTIGGSVYTVKDGPASLLPNGNVLVAGSPGTLTGGSFPSPTHFFEFDGTTLTQVADAANASVLPSYVGRMLLLPTGEVMLTGMGGVQIYSNGGAPQDAWRPVITTGPPVVAPGSSYGIGGKLFNGFSEGANYGDDAQMSSNYPLVRITNRATGHVFYARTHDHSRMGVELITSSEIISTTFDVPAGIETGLSDIEVVANGIPSVKLPITVGTTTIPVVVQTSPAGRSITVDGTSYTAPQTFSWVPSSSHTIAVASPQSGSAGTQYVFSSWSDSLAVSHTVAPATATTYTATFSTQYQLTMAAGTGGTVSPATGYFNPGQTVSISATPSSGYTFAAWTGSGSGSYTGATNSTTVTMNAPITETAAFTLIPTLPGPPLNVVAFAGNHTASVSFSPPLSDGGSAITSYRVTASPGGATISGASSPLVVTGLINDTTYTFTVTATNGNGTGAASAASAAVIPHAPNAGQDFDGDGRNDLLWRNQTTGQNIAWLMNGATMLSFTSLTSVPDSTFQIKGIADFNNDGKSDLLWRNSVTGTMYIWLMNGTTFVSSTLVTTESDLTWEIVGTPDLNSDGKPDILWNNISSGLNRVWYMNGLAFGSTAAIDPMPSTNWRVVGTADFNADSKTDIVVRNIYTGDNVVWYMNGVTHTSTTSLPAVADAAWELVAVADFTGDSKPDLVWRNPGAGQVVLWTMDGVTRTAFASIGSVPLPWAIVPSANTSGAVTPPTCSAFTISTSSISTPAAAGSQVITITGTPFGCIGGSWSMSGNGSWLTVSPASGTGSGTATVSWAQNFSVSARSANATVAGNTVSVAQAGGSPTVPGAPTSVVGAGRNGAAIVSFTAPASDGGSSILSYTVTVSPGGATISGASSPITVTGLANGTPYTFTVKATNGIGTGAASAPSAAVTPRLPNVGQDFNGDGKNDIVWRNQATGQNIVWNMNGATMLSFNTLPTVGDTSFEMRGLADFDGDGNADVLWRNANTGSVYIWTMNGTTLVSSSLVRTVADLNWDIAATGDFNSDGFTDIVWSNAVTGQNIVWFMNGLTYSSFAFLDALPGPGYRIAGAADFNTDGKPDLVVRNAATGDAKLWLMNGTSALIVASLPSVADTTWQIVTVADFSGDGRADLVWRNSASGLTILWVMNSETRTSFSVIGTVPLPWFVVAGQR